MIHAAYETVTFEVRGAMCISTSFRSCLSSPPAVQHHSLDLVRGLAELRYLMQQLLSGSRLPLATHFSPEEFHLIIFRACNSEVSDSPRPQMLAKAVGLQRVTALDEDACPTHNFDCVYRMGLC